MCSWKLPYFDYNVEFPTLCLSDGSQMPNTWWIPVFQLLNSNLGSLTFLYILFLHCLRYSRLCSPCSIVIYSEICGSYLAKLTTTLLGRGSLFPSMISFSHQSPYSLLSPTNVIFSPPLIFLHVMQSSPTDMQICSKQSLSQGPLLKCDCYSI